MAAAKFIPTVNAPRTNALPLGSGTSEPPRQARWAQIVEAAIRTAAELDCAGTSFKQIAARATFRQHRLLAWHNPVHAYEFADPEALSDLLVDHWTTFARTGDPNADGLPDWHPFADGEFVNSLAPGEVRGVDYPAEHRLAFWDAR